MCQCSSKQLVRWVKRVEQCMRCGMVHPCCALPQKKFIDSLQARRRLVSASRMAVHAAGYHLGRMQSAAMRTFESPAAQGYCKACLFSPQRVALLCRLPAMHAHTMAQHRSWKLFEWLLWFC